MEFLIWLVVLIAVIALGYFGLQALRKKNTAQIAQAISREAAQAANARLDDASRNSVYRNLAKGDIMGAVNGLIYSAGNTMVLMMMAAAFYLVINGVMIVIETRLRRT